jgi:hypothetical protein
LEKWGIIKASISTQTTDFVEVEPSEAKQTRIATFELVGENDDFEKFANF